MKKKTLLIISLICIAVLIFALAFVSCKDDFEPHYFTEYESGYFRYAAYSLMDGKRCAVIVGLTESGLEQEALIFPIELDGREVYGIGYETQANTISPWAPIIEVGSLESKNLKKLFFLKNPIIDIGTNVDFSSKIKAVYWNLEEQYQGWGYNPLITTRSYYKKFNNEVFKNVIFANVMYMYNYENSPNEGCYWIDSYDEGLITFMPPMPQREGYYFVGWYKEPECINKWDFDVDKTGKETKMDDNNLDSEYEGIYLYAKWVEI